MVAPSLSVRELLAMPKPDRTASARLRANSLPVIASAAKQPRGRITRPLGCFVASLLAMTASAWLAPNWSNDSGVIGRLLTPPGSSRKLIRPAGPPGEKGVAPGADFSFASSDFKTLGAFFCNFPSRSSRQLQPVSASGATGHRSAVRAASAASRDALVRELRAELGQSSSTFPRIDSYRPGISMCMLSPQLLWIRLRSEISLAN